MKIRFLLLFVLAGGLLAFSGSDNDLPAPNEWNDETPVADVLTFLGEARPDHYIENPSEEQIKRGYELVHIGRTVGPDGKKTKQQSRYYVCTNCHNTQREDPDLTKSDPETRLDYTIENEIPFLQGSTFWGIVNRKTWYNDDYSEKYGEAIAKAKNDLREAIRICSIQCSQGRNLEAWETEAILSYFWNLELKMGDLELDKTEWENLKEQNGDGKRDPKASNLTHLRSKFLSGSPAHFGEIPEDKGKGYGLEGDPVRGRKIFNQSCLACHSPEGPSNYLKLEASDLTKSWFVLNMERDSHISLYEIVRVGTHAEPGHKAYMPHYPIEKMSNQQVEDLRAFFEDQ